MSLSLKTVDYLFARFSAIYGSEFANKWAGQDSDAVKAAWAYTLADYDNNQPRIKWALEHLPERPPNALQFRALCALAPEQNGLQAIAKDEPMTFSKEVRDAIVAGMSAPAPQEHGMKQWAHDLKARADNGEKLGMNQIRCYKNALGLHPGGAQL